jgi:hypothetical protein
MGYTLGDFFKNSSGHPETNIIVVTGLQLEDRGFESPPGVRNFRIAILLFSDLI